MVGIRLIPLLVATAILLFYFLTDWGVLTFSRTESMYGLFAVVLLPLSGLLLFLQFFIWLRALRVRRSQRRASTW